MLNVIWPIFIIVSFVYAIFIGNIESINNGIFESCKNAVELSLTFLGTMCLWNGIMEIARKSKFTEILSKLLSPVVKFLFPDIRKEDKVYQEISMNMIANILGLGNASTPIGLRAMALLQEENENKDTVSDSMAMLIILNTASIQIIPTTVIVIRNSLGSENPTAIVFPVWIATICGAICGIIAVKILIKVTQNEKH